MARRIHVSIARIEIANRYARSPDATRKTNGLLYQLKGSRLMSLV